MNLHSAKLRAHRLVPVIYLATLLLSFHYVFVVYVNSNFLAGFFSTRTLGLLYAIGSLLNIIVFLNISPILERIRNYRLMLLCIVLEAVALIGMAVSREPFLIMALFVIHHALNPILLFSLDIFLEKLSKDATTGNIRGTFLTIMNATFVLSPLAVGIILGDGENFPLIYFLSAAFLVPLFYVIYRNFRTLPHTPYPVIDVKETVFAFWRDRNLWNVFIVGFLLQFFYTWMTIYTPLYLHDVIGFSWRDIGIIFSVMLLPFVIFEIPLGNIADRKLGEKEMMSAGILIMAVTTIALTFIASKNIAVWAILLFLTRIGASVVEIMTESYFFKHVNSRDTNLISFYRNTRPVAYIVGPIAAGLVFLLVENQSQYLFFALGIIMLLGLRYSLTLKDTR